MLKVIIILICVFYVGLVLINFIPYLHERKRNLLRKGGGFYPSLSLTISFFSGGFGTAFIYGFLRSFEEPVIWEGLLPYMFTFLPALSIFTFPIFFFCYWLAKKKFFGIMGAVLGILCVASLILLDNYYTDISIRRQKHILEWNKRIQGERHMGYPGFGGQIN